MERKRYSVASAMVLFVVVFLCIAVGVGVVLSISGMITGGFVL